MTFVLHRRQFLSAAALGSAGLFVTPSIAFANAPTERRFVFVIQRGAADGLDIVRPFADPAFASLRGALLDAGELGPKLDGTFALHPALAEVGKLYAQGQALFVHAVASPYRERSHFDGQNVLETGGAQPYAVKDGWLNRLLTLMPDAGEAIAIGSTIPAALRGPAKVSSYAPSGLPEPSDDLMDRVARLYGEDDQLHPLWSSALDTRMLAGEAADQRSGNTGRLAARFLATPSGPRIAMIETTGWDTHNAQAGRLNNQLKSLDRLIASLRAGLGENWANTTVLVATEFGRTAAVNGTGGTDHGTGSVAMVVGGAVDGGKVIADWPGLAAANLYEGRDLRPTASLNHVIAGVAGEALGIDPSRVESAVFARQ